MVALTARRATGGVLVVGVIVALVIIGPGDFFLPEESKTVDEDFSGGEVLKRGTFTGTGHEVSGTVALVRDANGLLLRFENYQQENGPDVFIYVTPSRTPDSASEIDAGTRIPIDGGEDGGESTIDGTFQQRLPASVTASEINGVAVWCDQFGVPFGYASLDPVNASSTETTA